MRMSKPWAVLAPLLVAAVLGSGGASAGDTAVTLGEVATPPESSGVDRAALRNAAEGELRIVDTSRLRKRRNVLVSVALIGSAQAPFACTVNALLRDAKTGTMLAVLEGRAASQGTASAATRSQVLRAAMRSAVRQIPEALAAN